MHPFNSAASQEKEAAGLGLSVTIWLVAIIRAQAATRSPGTRREPHAWPQALCSVSSQDIWAPHVLIHWAGKKEDPLKDELSWGVSWKKQQMMKMFRQCSVPPGEGKQLARWASSIDGLHSS